MEIDLNLYVILLGLAMFLTSWVDGVLIPQKVSSSIANLEKNTIETTHGIPTPAILTSHIQPGGPIRTITSVIHISVTPLPTSHIQPVTPITMTSVVQVPSKTSQTISITATITSSRVITIVPTLSTIPSPATMSTVTSSKVITIAPTLSAIPSPSTMSTVTSSIVTIVPTLSTIPSPSTMTTLSTLPNLTPNLPLPITPTIPLPVMSELPSVTWATVTVNPTNGCTIVTSSFSPSSTSV